MFVRSHVMVNCHFSCFLYNLFPTPSSQQMEQRFVGVWEVQRCLRGWDEATIRKVLIVKRHIVAAVHLTFRQCGGALSRRSDVGGRKNKAGRELRHGPPISADA